MALISQEVDAGKALYSVPSAGYREANKFTQFSLTLC